jgi:NAD(P)-dependent dehydrogenase (short-subunit alcohol dehydrogenase family)
MATILVTGASRGIGLEFVRQILRTPHTFVFAACRNTSKANPLLPEVLRDSGKLLEMDVADQHSIASSAEAIDKSGRKIDILINNAGILPDSFEKVSEATPENMMKAYQVNVIGPLLICQHFLPLLVSKSGGLSLIPCRTMEPRRSPWLSMSALGWLRLQITPVEEFLPTDAAKLLLIN